MKFNDRYKKLNNEQRQAVDTIDGPVMVIAGPGSGKTELLGMRVANILKQADVNPENILCLTFTDAASKNMKDRLSGFIGISAYKVSIHTFHSFALDVTYKFREEFYEAQQMKSAENVKQIEVLGKILESLLFSDSFSTKRNGTFVYLNSIKNKISKLKKAGITPEEYQKIVKSNGDCFAKIEEILIPFFEPRVSKKIKEQIPTLISQIKQIDLPKLPIEHISLLDYKDILLRSLLNAYEQAIEENSTKPITKWKDNWIGRDKETKKKRLKDAYQLDRNISLGLVYEKYQKAMAKIGLVDFDDMILDLIRVLLKKPGLLAELQEKYQYILVDEFQDTNEAQMRIIHMLTENPVNEGKPNVMVVGDDDQAIYKFQGAEINNILQFREQYPETKLITLVKNYRSTPAIVDFAHRVISQGDDRLVDRLEEVEKKLESANPDIKEGVITAHTFDTAVHEYEYIANEIKYKIENGVSLDNISVIARNHRQLQEIAPFLFAKQIPIQYERQRNVLEEVHINQIICMARLVSSLAKDSIYYSQNFLSTILSFPFWGLDRSTIWKLSIEAYKKQKTDTRGRWIDVMLESENKELQKIANWFLDLASRAHIEPMGSLLDELIGPADEIKNKFTSSFRRFYFHKDKYNKNPSEYIQFLSSLNTFVSTVRSYTSDISAPKLFDLVSCVDIYEMHNLAITDTSPYIGGVSAITLLTAHKAKGLEFDTVFVLNCQNEVWAKSQSRDMIAFPKNLSIDPAGDTIDDYLRLFFVAITRAKSNLYVTSYKKKTNGRDSLRVPFLETSIFEGVEYKIEAKEIKSNILDTVNSLEKTSLPSFSPLSLDEKSVLKPILDKYILSVTHLNNFLNVMRGGPHEFFEQNLLRFPTSKTPFLSYGVAMHATVESIHNHISKNEIKPNIEEVQKYFKGHLERENMRENIFEKYLKKGNEVWKIYLNKYQDRISATSWIETNFRMQQVFVENVQITGKIDKIVPNEETREMEVYDFKTGSYKLSWKESLPDKKVQLHGYKRQIIFYKLLVEFSRDYSKYTVNRGYLEFLNPTKLDEIHCLPYDITSEDVERLKKLIVAVDKKIRNLDFPDISKYEKTLKGLEDFENDLICGKI
ncbi:MAG: ATP-dependent helicase [Candidatus Magasanikbacteria bacterium]|nr:ATP-dependent helicase [Candidatus Magasanikbacteria bacterium]